MNIKDLQEQARELRTMQNWDTATLEQRTMFLVTEVGEVVKEVLNLSTIASHDMDKDDVKDKLGMEIYDVVWNLCDLANIVNIDLKAAFEKKREINSKRKW